MKPTQDCTSSFIFSRQPVSMDGFRLEHILLSYDFERGHYVDVFDKNRYSEEHWVAKAMQTAENGLLHEKFAIKNCHLSASSSLSGHAID